MDVQYDTPSFPVKRTGETVVATFDFANRLAAGETISTAVVTATVYQGTDGSPSSVINGSASITGTEVYQSVKAGVDGVTYLLECEITTSGSQTIEMIAFLPVSNEAE